MELTELKENVLGFLFSTFLKSEYADWKKNYSYYKENISIFIINKSDKKKYLRITLHNSNKNAIDSNSSSCFGVIYQIEHILKWNWFSSIRTRKIHKKYKNIVKYHKDKEEYDILKLAFDTIPIKEQRKRKLKKLNNEEK